MSCSRSRSQEGVKAGFEPRSVSSGGTCFRFFEISHLLLLWVNLSPVLRAQLIMNVTLMGQHPTTFLPTALKPGPVGSTKKKIPFTAQLIIDSRSQSSTSSLWGPRWDTRVGREMDSLATG